LQAKQTANSKSESSCYLYLKGRNDFPIRNLGHPLPQSALQAEHPTTHDDELIKSNAW
jgi:hypothetical protein